MAVRKSSTGHKYIYYNKSNDRYIVRKRYSGKYVTYGTFSDLGEAIECKKYYEKRFWVPSDEYRKRKWDNPAKYIIPRGNKYYVRKRSNGEQKHYGSYDTLEEAILARDELIRKGWNKYKPKDSTMSKELNKLKELSKKIKKGGKFYVK